MDKSKLFIQMCDCKQIQGLWENKSGDFIIYKEDGKIYFHVARIQTDGIAGFGKRYNPSVHIWLPRQDQLQGMIIYAFKDVRVELDTVLSRFIIWYRKHQEKPIGVDPFTSMEQLWLAFVMKEKFNKTWDGEWK